MTLPSIPFFRPSISEAAIDAVAGVLRSGWLTTGEQVLEFEREFAAYVGAAHAVAVNSGTAALHLGLAATGVGPGDEVIVPTMTFAATAEVAIHLGATPVLVDCDPATLNVDHEAIAAAITPRTRAVMPVHFAGRAVDMKAVTDLAAAHELVVVDDAAHALPARSGGHVVGTIGDATAFSFYANKPITTGEGGMLTTADEELAERARVLRLHGMSRGAWKRFSLEGSWDYDVQELGYKYNMPDILAALGRHQLARSDKLHDARRRLAAQYADRLADVPAVSPLDPGDPDAHAWHLYIVRLELDRLTIDRARFIELLAERGIGTGVHYKPLHMHGYFRRTLGYHDDDLPRASAVYPQLVSLPLYPEMDQQSVDRVATAVGDIAAANTR